MPQQPSNQICFHEDFRHGLLGLTCLSAALKKRAYLTAYFSSGDARFQRGHEFLSHQQFDVTTSYKDLRCRGKEFRNSTKDWPFQDSFDDECMLGSFTEWAGREENRPFFALVGAEVNFGVASEDFNALRHTDLILGKLLRWLESRELVQSTLVVVMGDHGEAFGQHGQWLHASHIYEENIHVPLMLINRRLFKGEQYGNIGGLVDVAPTIMDIINIPFASAWQGRSLFSSTRSQRAYFFAPILTFSLACVMGI